MAAVRIPQYTQQTGTPNGRVSGGQGRGLQSFDVNVEGIGRALEGIAAAREESETNDAKAQLAAEEPRAMLALAQKFADVQRTWTPEAKPVADQMFEAVDAYRADAETRLSHPKARELLAERGNQLKQEYGLRGLAFELQKKLDLRVDLFKNGYQNAANLASTDPTAFGAQLAQLNATILADSEIPESAKPAFIAEQSKAAAMQVAKAQAELAPDQVVSYSDALLGVTTPTLTVKGSGNVTDAIIARESGGRLFDAEGKILRGPAITTQDGRTVHAYGKYQLLEETAQATAKDLGVPWRPDVFLRGKTGDVRQDAETAEYHDLLGQAYIETQNALFGGNPVLIAAAHNMGPGATKGWADGRPYQTQSGKWWYPKHPMDLTAMPEETRKYIEGLGAVSEEPASKADTSGDEATPYRLLDTDNLLQVRNLALANIAERNRQQNEALTIQRDLFKQRIDDIEVAAKHGDAFDIPTDGELVTFLGPANAALTKQRLSNYQGMARVLKQVPGLSNDELQAMANAPDPDGTEDRENRQFVRDTLAQQASSALAARKADPGQAALDSSPAVRDMFGAWGAKASEFYEAGPQATPDQFNAMAKAQADFVRTNFALQRSWGIDQPKLPTAIVDKMAQGFRVQMERDPATAAAWIARLPDLLGNDDAVAQVGNKIGPLAWLAMDGVPGLTLARLQATQAVPEAKRYELLPAGTTKKDVEDEVRAAFDPLLSTLAYQNDGVTAERYRQAGVTLAVERLSRTGGSAQEAARASYAELFGDRNAVNGTYRVDASRYDAPALDQRLGNLKGSFPADRLQVTPEPGFSLEESAQRKARTVQKSAYWINNAAGTGVYLMHPNGPVLDRNGRPVEVLFDEAMKLPASTAAQSGVGASFRAAKGF